MMTCKEAATLLSQSQDEQLPLLQRGYLRFHLMICDHCTAYKSNLQFLRRVLSSYEDKAGPAPEDISPPDVRKPKD